jgi:hypothetical protein
MEIMVMRPNIRQGMSLLKSDRPFLRALVAVLFILIGLNIRRGMILLVLLTTFSSFCV